MNKRAQAWGFDLVIGAMIFFSAVTAFYIYSLNSSPEGEETLNPLIYDGNIVADSLLSSGYPEDWDSGNVIKIGILSKNKINETKLERFYNLTSSDYDRTKIIFNTKYNYYYFLSEPMIISNQQVQGMGLQPQNQKNLIKITRFVSYRDKPMTLNLYIWE